MQPQLIPLTALAQLHAAGVPFQTVESARWAYRRRHENGLVGAFVLIGNRIHVNVPKFHQLASEQVA